MRYKALTDLYYFATEILGYADLVESVHKPVCDHFLKLDPDTPLYELSECKNRLLLDPRGHFKTTIDIAHTVQLICCYPNIRILIVSGTQELAQRMLDEVRRHFLNNEKLRALFPAHKMTLMGIGTAYEFTTPARTNWMLREPTLSISTIGSVKAGSHFEYIKYDDVVNEVNSETKEQIEKTVYRFQSTTPLLDIPGKGYRDVIGTRYDHSDLYGWIIDNNAELKDWSVFCRAACTLPFGPQSVILFPQRFTYKILHKLWKENPHHFGCQYLNNPNFGSTSSFSEELLRGALVPQAAIPLLRTDPLTGQMYKAARVFICWDLAFGQKKTSDYTVGIVGAYDGYGRLFIVDMVRGRFSADELVNEFLGLIVKYRHFLAYVGVEKAGGSELLVPALHTKAAALRLHLPIDWIPTSPTKTKHERILGLLPLLKDRKLYINSELPQLEDFIKEFTRFPRTKHDDIPDATAMLLTYQKTIDYESLRMPITQMQFMGGGSGTLPFENQPTHGDRVNVLGYGLNG